MDWPAFAAALVFAVLGLGCLLGVVAGLPGTWLMIGLAVAMEMLDGRWSSAAIGADEPVTHGWLVIGACVVLAAAGEVVEAAAGAAGTRAGGGTRRGMIGAILGGFVGAIAFTPLIPIPIVGTLAGAVIGSFAGAVVAELTRHDPPGVEGAVRAGVGAAVGRVLGTMGKTLFAAVVWAVLCVSAFWP
jgi:uncharacterized protein YqgC (DUF456 family)